MALTVQEQLAQARIRELDALQKRTESLQPTDARGVHDLQTVQDDIARQREVLLAEQRIRADYRKQAEALQQLREHEALKARLRQAQAQRPLTAPEKKQYVESRERCRAALKEAGAPAAEPLDTQAAPGQLLRRQDALQKEFQSLYKANADLYQNGAQVADPCMACLGQKIDRVARNVEHRRRADVSKAAFSGQQKNKDTCALMSTQSILLETKGSAPPEGWSAAPSMLSGHMPSLGEVKHTVRGGTDMIDIGKKSGGYTPCNGTTKAGLSSVMGAAGIPATGTAKPSLDSIASELDAGKAVVVGYDARPVWGDDTTPHPLGHAVRVTGVERDLSGAVRGFYINDSGSGEAGKYVPADTFQEALDGIGGGVMSSSDAPIQGEVPAPQQSAAIP